MRSIFRLEKLIPVLLLKVFKRMATQKITLRVLDNKVVVSGISARHFFEVESGDSKVSVNV